MNRENRRLPVVTEIGEFAARTTTSALTPETKALLRRNILDSLGCAIAAQSGHPFQALRQQFEEYRAPGVCTLIGGGRTSPDQAALYNSALVRYVDLLDSYMAPGGLCHPSDNFGAVLAAAEMASASGGDFMLALATAYEIQCRITAVVPVMAKGFNHAIQLAVSVAAGTGKLLGLTANEIAHAIAIATVDNISLTCVHAEPVSEWKGFSPGMTAMRALYATSLANKGFTGPSGLFDGPSGLERMFGQPIEVDWSDDRLDVVKQTVLKKYCSLIHGQPVIEGILSLRRQHDIRAKDVHSVVCDIFQMGFDIAGGGAFGSKDNPGTKEQADYNLKYLIAAALIDGEVGPDQLEPARIQADDVQDLLKRVIIRPDDGLSRAYPSDLNTKLEIIMHDGRTHTRAQNGYEGALNQPMSFERVVEKFNWLAAPYANADLRTAIIETVTALENAPIRHLIDLLAQVSPTRRQGVNRASLQ